MMSFIPYRLIKDNTKIDFMKLKLFSFTLSLMLCLFSFVYIYFSGFNLGIDFKGGLNVDIRPSSKISIERLRESLNKLNIGEVIIQEVNDSNDFNIKIGGNPKELQSAIVNIKHELKREFANTLFEFRQIEMVGPTIGSEITVSGIKAMLLSFLGILIYIWYRFEWQFGFGIIIALMHDIILCLGFMSVTKLDFNISSVAALLTIIGYSVNDSVVIYDRIREVMQKYKHKKIEEVINLSINSTLSRTLFTVLTTLIANLGLIIFGVDAIFSFNVLMFFGIVVGTYSSIYISAPMLKYFGIKTLYHEIQKQELDALEEEKFKKIKGVL
jgi:preprotein translocase subunit SecF